MNSNVSVVYPKACIFGIKSDIESELFSAFRSLRLTIWSPFHSPYGCWLETCFFISSSGINLPFSKSIKNILPGWSLPFFKTLLVFTGNTPTSDAIITLSSFVT